MPRDLLARRLPLSGDLSVDVTVLEKATFTPEQLDAIGRRDGELFLDAAAGSGKTAVLVERFVEGVLEDGIGVSAILTITFTDKAAAEMRERIRARFEELGAIDAARATEGAFISTIHGFCARVLRAHSLAAGIDPAFTVLDELETGRLADVAFDRTLGSLAERLPDAVELIASYGYWDVRAAIQSVHGELRSRGERVPRLPAVAAPPDLEPLRQDLAAAGRAAAAELAGVADPSARVVQASERLGRLDRVLAASAPWPGDVGALRLPGGNGAALSTPVCAEYAEALARFRAASSARWAGRAVSVLDELLAGFAAEYERRKRAVSGLDFEDLELICRDLLRADTELRDRYRARFERVMVDELQDTNPVQLELIEMVSAANLFTVGDAQQAIYAFRHADVELFERRGLRLDAGGARVTLQTNFRSRAEILAVINRVFEGDGGSESEAGSGFVPLVPGRDDEPADDPRVELLVADREADWSSDGLASPWRVAEARALAARVRGLIAGGATPGEIVVLTRASTDMRAYERALEEEGVPTYTVGGRGYWSHPQVIDMVSYLRALANPRDEEALYGVLASPIVGVSPDALVLLGAAARESGRDPWWALRDAETELGEIAPLERERMRELVSWMARERACVPRLAVEELLDRVLERTGYDAAVLGMPGGQRRLANVRKLMRLGREHEAAVGPDLRGFLELVRLRSDSWRPDPDRGEAPIESESLDAVRLMTIHRAKGLEFEIVCVADLGRAPRSRSELLRVGRDGRLGLRVARPGTGAREPALAYDELGEERRTAEAAEERRLFYVAMTRARERLILSGAARLEAWGAPASLGAPPITWLGPALVPDVSAGEGAYDGVRFTVVRPDEGESWERETRATAPHTTAPRATAPETTATAPRATAPPPFPPSRQRAAPATLSYTSLAAYQRCGYRFYVERVLGVPRREESATGGSAGGGSEGRAAGGGSTEGGPSETTPALTAAERGSVVHALLERLDFRRPILPSPEAIAAAAPRPPTEAQVADIVQLVERFAATELRERLARATQVRREQRFAFRVQGTLITGALDVIASEPGSRMLVVDYKTDRLDGAEPPSVVAREYETQQLIYALAALKAGACEAEVVHVFLERPEAAVSASFKSEQAAQLEERLAVAAAGVLEGRYPVTDAPHRALCAGCPAESGLCSWPLAMTRREQPDTLF